MKGVCIGVRIKGDINLAAGEQQCRALIFFQGIERDLACKRAVPGAAYGSLNDCGPAKFFRAVCQIERVQCLYTTSPLAVTLVLETT